MQSILGVSDEVTLLQKDKHGKDPAGIICQTGDLATVVHLLEKYSTVYNTFVKEKRFDSVFSQYASWSPFTSCHRVRSNRATVDNRSPTCRSFTFDLNNNKRGIAVRHIENYEGVVDFPLFKKFLQFEDENIYFLLIQLNGSCQSMMQPHM